jgi:excisionase family DNA binding protein
MSPSSQIIAHDVFLTPAEVASALGVSPNTVTRWAREGRMPFQMTLGGHRRFEATIVEGLRRQLQEKGAMHPSGPGAIWPDQGRIRTP